MNKLGNFLWKLFSVTMVFFYHAGSNYAIAEEGTSNFPDDDPKVNSTYFTAEDVTSNTTTRTICSTGYYLASCGSKTIGTNWLRGMKRNSTRVTPDYYSYGSEDSSDETTTTKNMNNLHKFFTGDEAINYTAKQELGSYVSYTNKTALPEDYIKYANQILSNFCTNDTGNLANYVCNKCPNDATIEKSTVKQDSYGTGKLLWDSWNIHTIADCYMKEFSDDTGTYVYMANNVEITDSTEPTTCYYSTNVSGDVPIF